VKASELSGIANCRHNTAIPSSFLVLVDYKLCRMGGGNFVPLNFVP
jgi:hypothetical protein